MDDDNNADKEEVSHNFGVDTRKTYESLITRKEARIAKEAQFERRARALTRHFLKAHEQKESHKLDHLHEASQRSYDRSMAKVRDGFNNEAMMREMFREENHQIGQLMQERARQRELEEEKQQEKKAEREFYMQARIVHSKLQSEERQKRIEEMQEKRAQEIKDRMRSNTERVKEASQDKTETQVSTAAKFDDEVEKVAERRRLQNIQHNKERHEKLSARAEKEKRALGERQKKVERMQQNIRDAEAARQQQVLERRRLEEEALAKKVEEINMRNIAHANRVGPQTWQPPAPQPITSRRQENERAQASAKEADVESPKVEDRKVLRPGAPSFDSKELIESNNEAHKDYVLRAKELDKTLDRMHVDKQYKALAEGAAGLPDDYREARLRAVHQRAMGAKPKAPASKKKMGTAASEGGNGDSSQDASPGRRTKEDSQGRPARRTPRALRCGLCMREFPPDRLVGSALRRTVERMRNQSANLPNNKGEMASPRQYPSDGEEVGHASAAEVVDASAAKSLASNKARSLYDYEVKLCVNCDIFVRITSS